MMSEITKNDMDELIRANQPLILDLGCGEKEHDGRVGVDRRNLPGVDLVADLEQGLPFFPDDSVDMIYCEHFLEHVDNFEFLMGEIWRVLKPGGTIHILVPHFSSPYYFSDYTHKRFFGLYTFQYLSPPNPQYSRKVLNYAAGFNFRIDSLQLIFRSSWRSRRVFKRTIFQRLFNANPWMQEFYEENLCYIIPCSEIRADLSALKGDPR